ncbi:adenine nucleotide transporter [Lentinula novae-zelandiae]|nr:adenine nucleotide transporter [Lentinula novae-zelandiae]
MSSKTKPQTLSPLAAALAGALGACFSTAVVYPLDVAKTRIQALPKSKGKDDSSMFALIIRIFRKEGLLALYSGFGATMLNTFSMQYAYFFFYSFVRNSYISRITRKLPKGSKAPALSTAAELLLGAAAGALAQIFTIPVSVIATRQQVGRVTKPSSITLPSNASEVFELNAQSDDSFMAVAREIVEEEGVAGLWLGIKPGLVLTVNPAITYGMYERVKSLLLLAKAKGGSSDKMTALQSFVVGSLSKTLATIVTYPYIMAKVRIQARSADIHDDDPKDIPPPHAYHHSRSKHPGALDVLGKVFKREGFYGWYQKPPFIEPFATAHQGMEAQIVKAVLSQALLFMSKEQFEKWTLAFIVLLAQMRSK